MSEVPFELHDGVAIASQQGTNAERRAFGTELEEVLTGQSQEGHKITRMAGHW
jgi:hypothetical protein